MTEDVTELPLALLCVICRYWVATNGPLCEACAADERGREE